MSYDNEKDTPRPDDPCDDWTKNLPLPKKCYGRNKYTFQRNTWG